MEKELPTGSENIDSRETPERHVEYPRSPEEIKVGVSIAIIEKDGKFLIGKRSAKEKYEGKWAFPGGKLEGKESSEECLLRELAEELGVRAVKVLPYLEWDCRFSDGNLFHLIGFKCKIDGDPKPKVHSELRWVSVEELGEYDLLEGEWVLVDALKNAESKKEQHTEK